MQELPVLSDTARGMVERYIRDGFGMYVYYFPRSPQRVRHFAQEDSALLAAWHEEGRGPLVRDGRMRVVEGWVRLFTRILCAGYFPASLTNQLWGACVQDQASQTWQTATEGRRRPATASTLGCAAPEAGRSRARRAGVGPHGGPGCIRSSPP
jgi:hypothetical protein